MVKEGNTEERTSHARQVLASLVAAAMIVALAVTLVTAKIGPGVETREREEEQEELLDQREERLEERQDRIDEREDND